MNVLKFSSVVGLLLAVNVCFACFNGYFSDKYGQCLECPEYCIFCISIDKCSSCKTGYWGTICDRSCERCQPKTSCEKENGVCEEKCEDGYTGVLCDALCDERCVSCDRTNESLCDQCSPRMYGGSCENACPEFCRHSACDNTGNCTLGCKNGYWGPTCKLPCPEYCKNSSCNIQNGACSHGCVNNYTGTTCNLKLEGPRNNEKENDGNDDKDESDITSGRGSQANSQGGEIWPVILTVFAVLIFCVLLPACVIVRKKVTSQRRRGDPPQVLSDRPLLQTVGNVTSEDSGVISQETPSAPLTQDTGVFVTHEQGVPPDLLKICYLIDLSGTRAYISCQDPTNDPMTVLVFWKMVWEQKCSTIVKLTRTVEETSESIYWPRENETKTCGAFTVTLAHVHVPTGYFNERTFEIKTPTQKRQVIQMQFNRWHRYSLPEETDIDHLLKFRQRIEDLRKTADGPLIVHCSDGHSRSRLYVALDMLLKELEKQQHCDISQLLENLRTRGLFTTDEQYDFLRKTGEVWQTFQTKVRQKALTLPLTSV